jgi:phenylalanyl-tRNA synthetase alpha subunit
MLTLKSNGLAVPASDDVRSAYGDLLNGQVDDLTKIIDETKAATAKLQSNGKLGQIERAKMIEQLQDHAKGRISTAVESRRKKLAEAEKTSDREKVNLVYSAKAVLNHNETRARQLVGSR